MSQQNMDPELLDGMLDYVQKTSVTIKRAVDENQIYKQCQIKAAALRPQILELGKQVGCFPATQVKEAEAMLASHDTTLSLLKSAFDKIAELSAKGKTELGDAADKNTVKAAGDANGGPAPGSYDSLNDPRVGHKTSQKKASDFAIEKVLLPPG